MFSLLICVSSLSTVITTTIPWKYGGFDRFPAVFFGASPQGLESEQTMQLISNHSVGGWGWQQNNSYVLGAEEQNLYNQAQAFYNYMQNSSSSAYNFTRSTFVYRDAFSTSGWWNNSVTIINDSAYSGFWIKNNKGQVCWSSGVGGNPFWDFTNQSACDYYLKHVIDQVITNKPYINSVFFDEFDWITCDWNISMYTNCSDYWYSPDQKKEIGMASIKLFQKASQIMNENGIVPILSVATVMQKYMNSSRDCVIPEEDIINGLSNVSWIRYYEYFPDSNSFLNRIEEMKYNIPIQVHSYANPGASINPYYIGTFLITQQEYSYFGASNGWLDDNWSWHQAYDIYYGKPLMDPVKLNDTAFFRSFQHCNVTVDTKSQQAIIDVFN